MAEARIEQLGHMLQQYVTSEEREYGLYKVAASLTHDGHAYTLTLSCAGVGRYSTFFTYDHSSLRAEVTKLLGVLNNVVAFNYCLGCERETPFASGKCVVCDAPRALDQTHCKTLCQRCNAVRTFWAIKIDPVLAVCASCGARHKRLRPNHWIPLPWKDQHMDTGIARLKDVDVGVAAGGTPILTGSVERSGRGSTGIGYTLDSPYAGEFLRGVMDVFGVERLAKVNGKPFMAEFEDNILMKMSPLFDGDGKVFDIRAWRDKHKEP